MDTPDMVLLRRVSGVELKAFGSDLTQPPTASGDHGNPFVQIKEFHESVSFSREIVSSLRKRCG
jgi:hypothetical protein